MLDSFVSEEVPAADAAHALAESCMLSCYEVQDYKHRSNVPDQCLQSVYVLTDHDLKEIQASLHVGQVYGNATNSARTLVNMPGNMLTAADLGGKRNETRINARLVKSGRYRVFSYTLGKSGNGQNGDADKAAEYFEESHHARDQILKRTEELK